MTGQGKAGDSAGNGVSAHSAIKAFAEMVGKSKGVIDKIKIGVLINS